MTGRLQVLKAEKQQKGNDLYPPQNRHMPLLLSLAGEENPDFVLFAPIVGAKCTCHCALLAPLAAGDEVSRPREPGAVGRSPKAGESRSDWAEGVECGLHRGRRQVGVQG